MLEFPRWKVDVTVGGDVVKTFHETATTSAAAIAKAKHKMRGAVSSAGAFKFKATKVEAGKPERHHATKAAPKSQREMYYDAERRSGEINKTFLEMLPTMRRHDLEKLIEKRPSLWGRFAGYLTSGHVFADDPPSKTGHHATRKKSPEFDWEVSGPSDLARQGFMRGVKAKIKRIGVEAYDKASGTYLGSSYFSATSKTDALKQAQASGWYFKALAENSYKPLVMKAA